MGGIDAESLAACLDLLGKLEGLPPDHPDVVRVRQAMDRIGATTAGAAAAKSTGQPPIDIKPRRKRTRNRKRRSGTSPTASALNSPDRQPGPAESVEATADRGAADGTSAITVTRPENVKPRRKRKRNRKRRSASTAADTAVMARTVTGASDRIDDGTGRIPSEPTATPVGSLRRARSCYICREKYRQVDSFYHGLCPPCAAFNRSRRDARTDLTGRRALLTGGRIKIGMHIALRLLRDGAHTTITTRFPGDAVRRFTSVPDSRQWVDRLRVIGIDLRDPAQVIALADTVSAAGPLDILINNAAQTIRRPPEAYTALISAESAPLPPGPMPDMLSFQQAGAYGGMNLLGARRLDATAVPSLAPGTSAAYAPDTGPVQPGSKSVEIDAAGLIRDSAETNSWSKRVHEIDPVELLEVQLCNVTAPFILVSRLRPAMAMADARRRYVVNVTAMEGQFNRPYKGPGHPHTNMAKAALNMLTRTSAEDLRGDNILMTSVDTGWITDERPGPLRQRLAGEGFRAPLDLIDGASRVYDPIVRGEQGEDLYNCLLKNYAPFPW